MKYDNEEKLKEIESVIDYLFKNKHYNSLANRTYYYIFQNISIYLKNNNIEFETNGRDSHISAIEMYSKNKLGIPSMNKEKRVFNSLIWDLKDQRKVADYEFQSLTEKDAEKKYDEFWSAKNNS